MTLSTGVRQTGQGRPPSSYTTAQVSHRRWPHGTRAHSRVVPKQTGHSSALGCLDGCLDGAGAAGRLMNWIETKFMVLGGRFWGSNDF